MKSAWSWARAFLWGAGSLGSSGLAHAQATFDVRGFAQVDYVQDFMRVNPAWDDTLRPSRIPTDEGLFGSDGQAVISPRQSRLGVDAVLPTGKNAVHTRFEFDWFGVGVDEGKTTPRLRHAFGEWGPFLGGQTHSLFMDIDVFPNVLDYWGPSGMVFLRNPQLRVQHVGDPWYFALAIEKPTGDIDPGRIREIAPELGDAIISDDKIPDLTAQARFGDDDGWGHVQVGLMGRYIGFETLGTRGFEPDGTEFGWGVDLSANILFLEEKLILAAVYGQGIASYMNDGGTDLAPGGTTADPDPKAVPLFGGVAYLDHRWSEAWTSSLGYSLTWVDNTTLQSPDAFQVGHYASGNVLFSPFPNALVGLEGLWGMREDNNGDDGMDVRTQLSMKYLFSSLDHQRTP